MSYLPVTLTSPAQGDILYYDGSKFVNLAPSTNGFALTTHGAGANPTWTDTSANAVILAPNSVSRNLIQSTGDTIPPLVLKGHTRNVTAPLFDVNDADGNFVFRVEDGNDFVCVQVKADADETALRVTGWSNPNNAEGEFRTLDALGNFAGDVQLGYAGQVYFGLASSTGVRQISGRIIAAALDLTNASYKGRLVASCHDSSFTHREGWRIEADGAAARIGFLGATAAVRQTGGVATAGALYTATEQGMINAVYSAMRTFGLLT